MRSDLGVGSVMELDGAAICYVAGTTNELNLSAFFAAKGLSFLPRPFKPSGEAMAAYDQGKCDAVTGDAISIIGAQRSTLDDPSAHILLPEIISKEPLSPVVRHGDDQWFDIVKWTVMTLIQAEESGVTSDNVDELRVSSQDPAVQRLLGVSGDMGRQLGLSDDWAYRIVKQVGNYGEIFERNLGPETSRGMERGLNALWTNGGLMYAMPFR